MTLIQSQMVITMMTNQVRDLTDTAPIRIAAITHYIRVLKSERRVASDV